MSERTPLTSTAGGGETGPPRALPPDEPAGLDTRLPRHFRAIERPIPVAVAKRKFGDRRDRWTWAGDLVGTAGPGWRVVRHLRGLDARVVAATAELDDPEAATTLRWVGTRAPATVLVKLDDAARIVEVKVDAALPVRLRRGRLLYVDLDVDVVRDADGVVIVRDWDVFEAHVDELGYTARTRAIAAAGEAFGLALLEAWEPTLESDVAHLLGQIEPRSWSADRT